MCLFPSYCLDDISGEVELSQLKSEEEESSHGESETYETLSIASFFTDVHPKCTSTNNEKLFPHLNTSHLSEDAKQDLEAQLLKDTEHMIHSFASLVFKSCQSLVEQKINPESLAVCVLALDPFSDTARVYSPLLKDNEKEIRSAGTVAQVHSPLLKDNEEEIRSAGTVEKIFLVLKDHWSFINYGILEHIIKNCGTKEDKKNLREYKHQLKEFCQRQIHEVPPHAYGNESRKQNWAKVTFKLNKKFPTLEGIQETQRIIAQILDLKPSTLYLCRIDEGCVQLLYLIPPFVAKRVFPLHSDQEVALHDAQILKVDHDWVYKNDVS